MLTGLPLPNFGQRDPQDCCKLGVSSDERSKRYSEWKLNSCVPKADVLLKWMNKAGVFGLSVLQVSEDADFSGVLLWCFCLIYR